MSPVNYGKITISQETLAGFQSLPLSHILKPSLLRLDYVDPSQLTTQNADYEPLLYCGFCNLYDKYHEHDCDYNPPWDSKLLTILYSSMGTLTMAPGMMKTPTYPMKTHMLLQDVGRTTSTMNS